MIKRFMKLFAGLERAYGTYQLDGTSSDKGKAKGKALTMQEPVTEALWRAHLDGISGLGIVPIRDDNSVVFGVIDVDVYDLDLVELQKKIKKLKLPLILLRSKSGGAHLYLFLKRAMPAVDLRRTLSVWSTALGYPGIEIFPKQDELAGPSDVGNWINMPYFDQERTTRYALFGGKSVDTEVFLTKSEKAKVDPDTIDTLYEPAEDSQGAPPCLTALFVNGFPEGSMNNALMNCGVYAMKRWPGQWVSKVAEYNTKYFKGPPSEVKGVIKSLKTKEYFYMCKQPPIQQYCDKAACSKCEFGTGGGRDNNGMEIESLSKICCDPPMWIVQIGGKRIQMNTDDLINQSRFSKRCVEVLTALPYMLKADKWGKFIRSMLAEARLIEAPKDAGSHGQFLYHLEQFCVNKAPANSRDELLIGKPWHDEGKTYFRSSDLIKYLEQQRFRDLKPAEIYTVLHTSLEVEKKFLNLKGRGTNVWIVPSFEKQTEDFDVQRTPEEQF